MEYLDFELPIKELEEQLDKCIALGNESNVDVSDTCKMYHSPHFSISFVPSWSSKIEAYSQSFVSLLFNTKN